MAGVIGRIAPWRQSAWDWRAAGNFICGGSGAGLLLIAAIGAGPNYPVQAAIGMILIGLGLLSVWAEIGRPWRALNVFRHARTSWMTREALLAPVLFLAGTCAAVLSGRLLVWTTAALAVIYLYCQARMLNAGRGIPAWRHRYTIPLIMITGCTEGAGWCVLTQAMLGARAMPAWLPWVLAALAVARLLVYGVYRSTLARAGAPRNALLVLTKLGWKLAALDVAVVLAVILSVLLAASSGIVAVAGLLAVLSGGLLKYTIVVRAAFNQGFALPRMPDRGSGSISAVVKPGW